MSLRRTVSLVMVLLSVLALASAMSTVQLTKYLVRTVSLLRTNLESVRAARQIDHLNGMVGDLLDAYRIESGNLELRPEEVDARELLREACDLFRNTSAAHELSIELPETPVVVTWDPGRIAQVLNNLLSNAIKYSPAGGLVTARLQQAGTHVLVEVVDSGVGIPPDDIARIFEPFRRSRLSRQAIPGVGLGLFVAQHIVEAHGGRIQVQSRVGVGTTFTVSIPRRAPTRQTEPMATKNIA